jgi:hypothetical protein
MPMMMKIAPSGTRTNAVNQMVSPTPMRATPPNIHPKLLQVKARPYADTLTEYTSAVLPSTSGSTDGTAFPELNAG